MKLVQLTKRPRRTLLAAPDLRSPSGRELRY